MIRRGEDDARSTDTDARARLALFHGTSVSAANAIQYEDADVRYDLMLKSGVKAVNLLASGMGPMSLKRRGFEVASSLRSFGFDALHLCDPSWCNEMCMAYGSTEVIAAFVISADDAVAVAGSEAMQLLNMSSSDLLERCAGFPGQAFSVLQQLPHGGSLRGVTSKTLLDAGLRVNALKACGYGFSSVADQTGANARDLSKLGFSMG